MCRINNSEMIAPILENWFALWQMKTYGNSSNKLHQLDSYVCIKRNIHAASLKEIICETSSY